MLNPQSDIPDAAHGRTAHIKARLARPLTLIAPGAIFGLVLLGDGTPGDAALSALVTLGVVVALAIRSGIRASREDFYASYASSRGLERRIERDLPEVTPLLRMGTGRHAERMMAGVLPGGLQGALALYTYEEAEDGDRRAQARRFTVVLHRLPGVLERILELHCVPRSASAAPSGIEGFRTRNRLQLESIALDRRYEIYFGPDDDEHWLRRLYSPSFIVWLTEQATPGFGFQLTQGHLCAFISGHLASAAALDALCQSTAIVATRLTQEASE